MEIAIFIFDPTQCSKFEKYCKVFQLIIDILRMILGRENKIPWTCDKRKSEEYISFVYIKKYSLYSVWVCTHFAQNVILSFITFNICRKFVKSFDIKSKNNNKNFPIKEIFKGILYRQKNQMLTCVHNIFETTFYL